MKKSLLAVAVLGAFAVTAQAQTNVTIGGVMQAQAKSYSIGSGTVARPTQTEYRIDDDFTSRFWLTGTEDLGGGNSAIFYIENRLNTDVSTGATAAVGNGLSNGDTWVGLKGGWGQVTLGKHSWMGAQGLVAEVMAAKGVTAMPSSMWMTASLMNQTGRNFVDYIDGASRRQNSITYRTPAMSGFAGVIGASTNPAATEGVANGTTDTYSDGREYFLGAGYNNGPISANLAYLNNTAEGATSTANKQLRFWGSYTMGAFKLGLIADRATRDTATTSVSRTAWGIPVRFVFGNSAILASIARAGDLGGVANTGAKMYTVGFDHALSARTNAGVYYSRMNNDSAAMYQPFGAGIGLTGSALTAGESGKTLSLGVKHTF